MPFSGFQLHLRGFYALGDTRTPAIINIGVNAVDVAADLVLIHVLPGTSRLPGLAAGRSLSYAAGFALTAITLRGRLGALHARRITRTATRLVIAFALATGGTLAVTHFAAAVGGAGAATSTVSLILAAPLGCAIFLRTGKRLRVAEFRQLLRT